MQTRHYLCWPQCRPNVRPRCRQAEADIICTALFGRRRRRPPGAPPPPTPRPPPPPSAPPTHTQPPAHLQLLQLLDELLAEHVHTRAELLPNLQEVRRL